MDILYKHGEVSVNDIQRQLPDPPAHTAHDPSHADPTPPATPEPPAHAPPASIDAQGEIIQEHGDDPDFSGAAAYATRLAHLTGEMLGLGEFLAMECRSQDDTRFVYRDEHGGMVACQPEASSTAALLRKRLGL